MRYDAPDLAVAFVHRQCWIIAVLGSQMRLTADLLEPLDGEVALRNGNDDIVGFGCYAAINDQQIAIEDTYAAHRFSRRMYEERSRRPAHQMLVEVELALDVVIRRAWKPSRHLGAEQWDFEFERGIGKAQHWDMFQNHN